MPQAGGQGVCDAWSAPPWRGDAFLRELCRDGFHRGSRLHIALKNLPHNLRFYGVHLVMGAFVRVLHDDIPEGLSSTGGMSCLGTSYPAPCRAFQDLGP